MFNGSESDRTIPVTIFHMSRMEFAFSRDPGPLFNLSKQLRKDMLFTDSYTVGDTRNLIDQEIYHLSLRICHLKTRRNSLAFVSRLPAEILGEIFLVLAEKCQSARFVTSFAWLRVTHVCRLWREVAMGHGKLWGRIDTVSQERTEEFLSRSRGAPLALRHCVKDFDNFPALLTSGPEIPRRFREFHLQAPRIAPDLLKLISSPQNAFDVESIIISTDPSDDPSQIFLPAAGFGECAPQLARIQLMNLRLEWPTAWFPALTQLFIHHGGDNPGPRPDISCVISALRNMPRLEILHLVDSDLFHLPDNTPVMEERVTLPHLSVLHLFGTVAHCNTLLSRLSPAKFVELELHCTEVAQMWEVEDIFRFVKRNFGLSTLSAISLHVESELDQFVLTGENWPRNSCKPFISVGLYPRDLAFLRGHSSEICTTAALAVPSRVIAEFNLKNNFEMSTATWASILQRATQVRRLNVFFNSALNLPNILDKEVESSTAIHLHCPRLRLLTISGVSFSTLNADSVPFSQALRDCLKRRNVEGAGIKTLAFNSCADVASGVAMQFDHLVDKVYWDREFEFDSSDIEIE